MWNVYESTYVFMFYMVIRYASRCNKLLALFFSTISKQALVSWAFIVEVWINKNGICDKSCTVSVDNNDFLMLGYKVLKN